MSHVYAPNGEVVNVLTGEQGCLHCPLRRGNKAAHDMPDTPAELLAEEARRLGEREDLE